MPNSDSSLPIAIKPTPSRHMVVLRKLYEIFTSIKLAYF